MIDMKSVYKEPKPECWTKLRGKHWEYQEIAFWADIGDYVLIGGSCLKSNIGLVLYEYIEADDGGVYLVTVGDRTWEIKRWVIDGKEYLNDEIRLDLEYETSLQLSWLRTHCNIKLSGGKNNEN